MKTRIFTISLLYFILWSLNFIRVFAQGDAKQLIITEANLDFKNQEVWIEIFNPTNEELILNSLRISGVRTLNILPPEIRKQNGIKLKPGEYLVVCSDINSFTAKYGSNINILEVKLLKNAGEGGFIAINNLDNIENAKKNYPVWGKRKIREDWEYSW
ncbi:hypothetical protein [Stygiobacter electus]|uniref:LTD domain-containing protein n=1 Tax=Stygiobacter electus TaxID=3032292 RepID=A0AAE3TET6_9BACT|nr:hypothetical protein [Stygiobacter electus]MDF1612692.1 hypothetical protein [Stygiobacter electus]